MRTKNAALNLLTNLLLQVVTAVIGFILPRLFITTYGSSVNGLISSIKQFLSYLKIVEAGVGNASTVALYKPLTYKDEQKINIILSATRHFYIKSALLFGFLVVILAVTYPRLIKEVDYTISFYLVLILGISGLWDFLFIGKYRVLFTADQKSYILFRIQVFLNVISTILSVLLVVSGYSILIVVFFSTIIMFLNLFFIKRYTKKNYPYINYKVNFEKDVLSGKWSALVHQIAGLIIFSSPLIIITIFEGLAEVSVYSVYNMVFNAVLLIISAFSSGLIAGFGDLIARDNMEKLQKTYDSFEYLFYPVVCFFYSCTLVLIIPFMQIYTSGINDANYLRYTLAFLFIAVGLANAVRIPASLLVNSAGHFMQTRNRAIIEAVINLSTSIFFVINFGTEGVLMGALCSYLYRTIDLILYASKKILKRSSKRTFKKITLNLILSIISITPFLFIDTTDMKEITSWISYALIVAFTSFSIILLGNFIIDFTGMKEIFMRIKNVFFSKKKFN